MSELKEKGEIIAINEVQPIGSEYQKLVFAIKNNTGYEGREKILAFEIFESTEKDKVDNFLKFNKVGKTVDVDYEIDCRPNKKTKGHYFTTLKAWKVFGSEASDSGPVSPAVSDEALDEQIAF